MNTLEKRKEIAADFILSFLSSLFDPDNLSPENRERARDNVLLIELGKGDDKNNSLVAYMLEVDVRKIMTNEESVINVSLSIHLNNPNDLKVCLSNFETFKSMEFIRSDFMKDPDGSIKNFVELLREISSKN